VFIAGGSLSSDLPTDASSFQQNKVSDGSGDGFIAKISNDLSSLSRITYLGGFQLFNQVEGLTGITIDSSDNVIVVGKTNSNGFPVTSGAFDTTNTGLPDGRAGTVSKLSNDLTTLSASTYLKGSGGAGTFSEVEGVVVDSNDNIIVVGFTNQGDFPTNSTSLDTTYNGGSGDIIISKFTSDLTTLTASTYFGGSSDDRAFNVVKDNLGNLVITGKSLSSDLPLTSGTFSSSGNNFIAKFDSTLISTIQVTDSTFLGGTDDDAIHAMTKDSSGNIYVVGHTLSTNFPTTTGAFDTALGGTSHDDVFITKIKNDLTGTLLASTFLGGTDSDIGNEISIDNSGNVFVVGDTQSESDFPTTAGAFQTSFGGGFTDAFVAKLDSSLSTLSASTYLGGSDDEFGSAIALDASGNVYFGGETDSSDYPTTAGALFTSAPGVSSSIFDGVISKLDNSLTILLASTYLGGAADDFVDDLVLDNFGNVYVTGGADDNSFPTTTGAFDTTHNSSGTSTYDIFVSELNSSLSTLLRSTFIGDSGTEEGTSIDLDNSGNVFVTGSTSSSGFPTTTGAFQTSFGGGSFDVTVSKLDSTLSTLLASTFLGGSNDEFPVTILIGAGGGAFIVGDTESSDYPVKAGTFDNTFGGGTTDAFVTNLSNDLTTLIDSTFLGDTGVDTALGIVEDGTGLIFVSGDTSSSGFPTTTGSFDTTFNGGGSFGTDAFITKIDFGTISGPSITALVAADPDGGPAGYSNDDTITVFFSVATNQPFKGTTNSLTKTDLLNLFTFSQNLGDDFTGTWFDSSTLIITVVNSNGADPPTLGDLTVTVNATANLKNSSLSSQPSTATSPSLTGDFGFASGPFITAFVADDPDSGDNVYSVGDTLTVRFSEATNQPFKGTTNSLTKTDLLNLFTFSQTLGDGFTGTWNNPSTLIITITDITNATPPTIDSLTVTVKTGASLKNEAGNSLVSTSTSGALTGSFGTFTVSITVAAGGTSSIDLPSGQTVEVTLDETKDATITITKETAEVPETFTVLGDVLDVTASASACAVQSCEVTFIFNQDDLDAINITLDEITIFLDSNEDGNFQDDEAVDTTVTGTVPGPFTATADESFGSKFAVGGVKALAVGATVGGGGGSAFAPSFTKPPPSFGFGAMLDSGGVPIVVKKIEFDMLDFENEVETEIIAIGEHVEFRFAVFENSGGENVKHFEFLINLTDKLRAYHNSDTYIIYDEESSIFWSDANQQEVDFTLTKQDPHGFFESVDFDIEPIGDYLAIVTLNITFAKAMPESDIYLRIWDAERNSRDVIIKNAIEIIDMGHGS